MREIEEGMYAGPSVGSVKSVSVRTATESIRDKGSCNESSEVVNPVGRPHSAAPSELRRSEADATMHCCPAPSAHTIGSTAWARHNALDRKLLSRCKGVRVLFMTVLFMTARAVSHLTSSMLLVHARLLATHTCADGMPKFLLSSLKKHDGERLLEHHENGARS